MFVKICGITTAAALDAAVAAGADAVGFVFAESPRRIAPAEARRLCAGLPATVLRVAVMRRPTPAEWAEVSGEFAPDWLQADAAELTALDLRGGCLALPVFRAPPEEEESLPARLLFEGPASGRGRRADWPAARTLAARTELVLAGGLDPNNVQKAIATVRPWGVDVSSGVERRRGEKDPGLIEAFVARARAGCPGAGGQERR